MRGSSTRTSRATRRPRDAAGGGQLQHPSRRRPRSPPRSRPDRQGHRRDQTRRDRPAGGPSGERGGPRRPGPLPVVAARHARGDGRDARLRRRRHLRQRGAHAAAGAELAALRSLLRRPRAARLPAGGPERQRHRAARLQLPLRPGLSRAPRPGGAAVRLPEGRRLRGPAPGGGRLQRVAPGAGHPRPPPRILLSHAPHAPHASGLVPALPARPHLLGRRAGGSGVPRPPQPPGPRRLRPPAGRRPPARATARAHGALPHRRRAAAGRIATPTDLPPVDPEPLPAPALEAAAPASPRASRAITMLAAVVLLAFVILALRLHSTESRLAAVSEPERALALVVGRTMDVETALTVAPRWERQLYAVTLSDAARELDQAITWYEELAAYSLAPAVDLRLAILRGEAGREQP